MHRQFISIKNDEYLTFNVGRTTLAHFASALQNFCLALNFVAMKMIVQFSSSRRLDPATSRSPATRCLFYSFCPFSLASFSHSRAHCGVFSPLGDDLVDFPSTSDGIGAADATSSAHKYIFIYLNKLAWSFFVTNSFVLSI